MRCGKDGSSQIQRYSKQPRMTRKLLDLQIVCFRSNLSPDPSSSSMMMPKNRPLYSYSSRRRSWTLRPEGQQSCSSKGQYPSSSKWPIPMGSKYFQSEIPSGSLGARSYMFPYSGGGKLSSSALDTMEARFRRLRETCPYERISEAIAVNTVLRSPWSIKWVGPPRGLRPLRRQSIWWIAWALGWCAAGTVRS